MMQLNRTILIPLVVTPLGLQAVVEADLESFSRQIR